jgi:hypothetical protein
MASRIKRITGPDGVVQAIVFAIILNRTKVGEQSIVSGEGKACRRLAFRAYGSKLGATGAATRSIAYVVSISSTKSDKVVLAQKGRAVQISIPLSDFRVKASLRLLNLSALVAAESWRHGDTSPAKPTTQYLHSKLHAKRLNLTRYIAMSQTS